MNIASRFIASISALIASLALLWLAQTAAQFRKTAQSFVSSATSVNGFELDVTHKGGVGGLDFNVTHDGSLSVDQTTSR